MRLWDFIPNRKWLAELRPRSLLKSRFVKAKDPETESAVFDGRRLTVIRLNCGRCNRSKDVYFIAGAGGPTVFQN